MIPVLTGFLITLLLTPIVIKLNILDIPNERKIHSNPIPKAGGLGVFASLLISAIVFSHFYPNIWFIAIIGLMTAVGLRDDVREIESGAVKLFIQIAVAVLALVLGFRFSLPGELLAWGISFFWIISYINSFNLIDGMDGLAGGVGLIQVGFLLMAAGSAGPGITVYPLGLIFVGAVAGFLVYNFNPARIFLGDTGSTLIGLFVALFAIEVQAGVPGHWFNHIVGIGLITGFPIFDTVQTVIRRVRNNKPLMAADRSHTYNLLVDKYNLTTKQTVLLVYVICVVLGVAGLFVFNSTSILLSGIILAVTILVGLLSLTKGLGAYSHKDKNFSG